MVEKSKIEVVEMKLSKNRKAIVLFADVMIFIIMNIFMLMFSDEFHDSLRQTPQVIVLNILGLGLAIGICQFALRTYDSLWRYAEIKEYFSLFLGTAIGSIVYTAVSYGVVGYTLPVNYLVSVTALTSISMLIMRFAYRLFRQRKLRNHLKNADCVPVAIIGAGSAGVMICNEFLNNPKSKSKPACFFDDDKEKHGKLINGVPVVGGFNGFSKYIKDKNINNIVVAIPSAKKSRQQEILQECNKIKGAKIRVLPATLDVINSKSNTPLESKLRPVQIEDLLGRDPINMSDAVVSAFLANRVVMVTGGGGSIGSELCRQIAANNPKHLIIIDIYENNAYDIQQELREEYGDKLNLSVEIASIRDNIRIESLFEHYKPEVVFHAAAHKHVPLMETTPQEAVRNNVFGTYNVIMAAHHSGVKKFVQISTDKAVNPTNVMGATKRMCEFILQSMQGRSNTDYVAVRFGNVLGSNGSVIPLFKRQIAKGGPVAITDKRIIRYFMTIPEASQLVLQAGAMNTKNDIFVLDMGQPIKILDLAENLISLSGYVPYEEIPIVEIGLRPGEKLYEELLVGGDIEKTENELIFIEHQPPITQECLAEKLDILREALQTRDNEKVKEALHKVVPTYHTPEEVNNAHVEQNV